jgi:hypothetical protein
MVFERGPFFMSGTRDQLSTYVLEINFRIGKYVSFGLRSSFAAARTNLEIAQQSAISPSVMKDPRVLSDGWEAAFKADCGSAHVAVREFLGELAALKELEVTMGSLTPITERRIEFWENQADAIGKSLNSGGNRAQLQSYYDQLSRFERQLKSTRRSIVSTEAKLADRQSEAKRRNFREILIAVTAVVTAVAAITGGYFAYQTYVIEFERQESERLERKANLGDPAPVGN